MKSALTIEGEELDWEPEADDPDDSLKIAVYAIVDELGWFWTERETWNTRQELAKRYFSKKGAETTVKLFTFCGFVNKARVIEL